MLHVLGGAFGDFSSAKKTARKFAVLQMIAFLAISVYESGHHILNRRYYYTFAV